MTTITNLNGKAMEIAMNVATQSPSALRQWLQQGDVRSQQYQDKFINNDSAFQQIADFCEKTGDTFVIIGNAITKTIYYITNPLVALGNVWSGLVYISFWATTLSITTLLLYMVVTKSDRIKKWIGGIGMSYLLIQAINAFA